MQDTINKLEAIMAEKDNQIEKLGKEIFDLHVEKELFFVRERHLTDRYLMCREDLENMTHKSLKLKEDIKKIENGIVGIIFNREQREAKNQGMQTSIMTRSEMIKDYVKRHENLLRDNIYSYNIIKNSAYDELPFNKFQHVIDYVASQVKIEHKTQFKSIKPKKTDIIQNVILEKTKLNKKDIDFADYKMAGPTFAHLVKQDLFLLSMHDIEEAFSNNLKLMMVIETIRAVFDSYFIELQSHDKLDTCLDFGSFVYLWLEKFDINEVTKEMVASPAEHDKLRRRRSEFAVKLTSPVFQKLWDSYIFNEFLSDKFSKDDILFYLNCRSAFMLGLERETRGTSFDTRQLVPISHVLHGLSLLLHAETPQDLEQCLVYQLVQSVPRTSKKQVEYVDVYQVLRICLEEYRYMKISKFITFYELLDAATKKNDASNKTTSFATFHTCISKFYSSVTMSESLALFRKSINVGRGELNMEAVWTAGEESGCFAFVERFGVYSKKDLVSRHKADPRGKLCHIEKVLGEDYDSIQKILDEYPKLTNYEDAEPHQYVHGVMRKLMHTSVNDQNSDYQMKILKWANSLGCLHYSERYEQQLVSFHEKFPKSYHYTMNLANYLSKCKQFETRIVQAKESSLYAIYSGVAYEFGRVKELLISKTKDVEWLEGTLKQKRHHRPVKARPCHADQTKLLDRAR
jgi:hypothetical protein